MEITSNQQASLSRAALESITNITESIEEVSEVEVTEDVFDAEAFVVEYLSDALKHYDLQEDATEEDIHAEILNIVESVNFLAVTLNEYFEIE
jgi:hypothetical protein